MLSGGVHALRYTDVRFHPDALDDLQAAMVLAVAVGDSFDDVEKLARAEKRPKSASTSRLFDVVREGVRANVALAEVVVAALLGDPGFPEPQLGHPVYGWAHSILVEVNGVRAPVLKQCVAREAATGWTSFDQLAESVRELLWERLKQSDNRERAHRVCGKFAQSWLKPLFPGEGLLGRFRGGS
jgi:hypothetical protein